MTQFHEGQDVKVLTMVSSCGNADVPYWRKAKIVPWPRREADRWRVQFPDGKRGVFDAADIRAVSDAGDWEVWPNASTYKGMEP